MRRYHGISGCVFASRAYMQVILRTFSRAAFRCRSLFVDIPLCSVRPKSAAVFLPPFRSASRGQAAYRVLPAFPFTFLDLVTSHCHRLLPPVLLGLPNSRSTTIYEGAPVSLDCDPMAERFYPSQVDVTKRSPAVTSRVTSPRRRPLSRVLPVCALHITSAYRQWRHDRPAAPARLTGFAGFSPCLTMTLLFDLFPLCTSSFDGGLALSLAPLFPSELSQAYIPSSSTPATPAMSKGKSLPPALKSLLASPLYPARPSITGAANAVRPAGRSASPLPAPPLTRLVETFGSVKQDAERRGVGWGEWLSIAVSSCSARRTSMAYLTLD